MPLIKLNTQSAASLDATKLTGNLPAISGASLTGISAGIVVADNWRLSSTISTDTTPLTNWERVDTAVQGTIGTSMGFSSGNFTFPQTGIWFVSSSCLIQEGSSTDNLLQYTMTFAGTDIMQIYQETAMSGGFNTGYNSTLLDVTDVSNTLSFKFVNVTAGAELRGSSTVNLTNATFLRLGDT